MNHPEDAKALCPFYGAARENRIRCESRIGGAACCHIFKSEQKMIEHKRAACDTQDWERCPYAEALLLWWEGQHGKI